jgi:hypothetical protein
LGGLAHLVTKCLQSVNRRGRKTFGRDLGKFRVRKVHHYLYLPSSFYAPYEVVILVGPLNCGHNLSTQTAGKQAPRGLVVEANRLRAGRLLAERIDGLRERDAVVHHRVRGCSVGDRRRGESVRDPETHIISGSWTCGLTVEPDEFCASETVSAVPDCCQ